MTNIDSTSLLKEAREVHKHAHVSKPINANGAALLDKQGNIYTGCTVESINQGSSICAPRAALAKAVSEGVTEFLAIAVVGSGWDSNYMCGTCRQLFSEFGEDIIVITETGTEKHLYELLPSVFNQGSGGTK